MKIALIGRYGEGDILPGPERFARELYFNLKRKNLDVVFIEYFFSGCSGYSFLKKIFGNKINHDGVLRLGVIMMIVKLFRNQFDIIHFVNSQRFNLIIFFIKPFLKARFISSFHGFNETEAEEIKLKRAFLDRRVERVSAAESDILIFPSRLLMNIFKKKYHLQEDKCRIIPNGVSKCFSENKIHFNPGESYNFVYFHSFGKGSEEIISALSLLNDAQINLFIIGKGTGYENPYESMRVFNIDFMSQKELIIFLQDKHFIIKSSAFDSFSIFTAECMTIGIIPVVSENTGIKELIEDKRNGFIYDSGKDDLQNLIRKIINGEYNLKEISANASGIYEKLNWENISARYTKLYESFL